MNSLVINVSTYQQEVLIDGYHIVGHFREERGADTARRLGSREFDLLGRFPLVRTAHFFSTRSPVLGLRYPERKVDEVGHTD